MAEYVPLYLPGQTITKPCSANVTGGQPVYASGNNTIANTAAAANIPIGVASFDGVSGDQIQFVGRGAVHRLLASGTVTAGDVVEMAAAGAVATHTVGTNDARAFGVALTTATAALVEIMEL
jgi:hypothetical protein